VLCCYCALTAHAFVVPVLEIITVNPEKPESVWPFVIYPVPDFPAATPGQEHRGFYIMCPVDPRFEAHDDTIDWYTGRVINDHMLHFKIPAWPYHLFPNVGDGTWLYEVTKNQVLPCVQKSMNHAHSMLDEEENITQELRKWHDLVLDFSQVQGLGYLDSACLYADAGPKKVLDFDLIDVPMHYTMPGQKGNENGTGRMVHTKQTVYGFKVGCLDFGPTDGRKTQRTQQGMSKAAQKRAQKAANQANQGGPKPMNASSGF
jgi:hypothetical protein